MNEAELGQWKIGYPSSWSYYTASLQEGDPQLTLTAPSSNEKWWMFNTHRIQWQTNLSGTVKLEYSLEGGGDDTWNVIATQAPATQGYYDWQLPLFDYASNNCKIRISGTATNGGALSAVSNTFNITSLELLQPNGGEKIQAGTTMTVRWQTYYSGDLLPWISYDGGATWQYSQTVNAQAKELQWYVPQGISSDKCLFYLEDLNGMVNDVSDHPFTIAAPHVKVLYPNGGEHFYQGRTHTIQWEALSNTPGVVDLYYATDGGTNWTLLAQDIPYENGQYNWTILQGLNSTTAKVRVHLKTPTSNLMDETDYVFTLSYYKVTSPTGGEGWRDNTTEWVSWEDGVATPSVTYNIEALAYDGKWVPVATNVSGRSAWVWPPNQPCGTRSASRIRVRRNSDGEWVESGAITIMDEDCSPSLTRAKANTTDVTSVELYPNPVQDIITLKGQVLEQALGVTASLQTVEGQQRWPVQHLHKTGTGAWQLNVAPLHLKPGVYTLTLQTDAGQTTTLKFSKN